MFRNSALTLALLAFTSSAAVVVAQEATPPQAGAQAPKPQTTTLRTTTQLVIVDVVVQDSNGKPVRGLKRDDFHIAEGKSPQNLRNFEEHSSTASAAPAEQMPMLPPGTFTDYTPVKPDSVLNIVLLDSLNTPMTDQNFVRFQLGEYVKHADSGAQIAIFGLGSRLTILQSFTADPHVLRDAVQHKLTVRASHLLDDPTGSNTDQTKLSDAVSDAMGGQASETVANLQQFEAETASFQTQLRMRYTLDAFYQLAHYLSAFPGRKNLIWFSGSFPLNILPDASISNPFAVMGDNEGLYREVTNLLTRAQVAVYPVDARGLMTTPMMDASRSGKSYARNPTGFGTDLQKFGLDQTNEHGTMQRMADDTGGRAFYNTNGLAQAVSEAINAGSNYYTLTYTPTDRNWNGAFRTIHVELSGAAAAKGLKLSYRRGYYADDATRSGGSNSAATTTEAAAAAAVSAANYARVALTRGAPTPSDILFKARVLPASTSLDNALAPDNNVVTGDRMKPPYRRYVIDYAALASTFTWKVAANGNRDGTIEFLTVLFDLNGRELNRVSKAFHLNVTADTFSRLTAGGIRERLEISAPEHGDTFFRVAVHDVTSNHFGVVEVPSSAVSHLAPPKDGPAPASEPAKPLTLKP